jgi:hypothetical protein
MAGTFKRSRCGHPFSIRHTSSERVARGAQQDEVEESGDTEFPELNSIRYKGSDLPEDPRPAREPKRTVRPAYWNSRD